MYKNVHATKFVFEADDNDVMFSEEIIRPVLAAMKVGLGFQVMDAVCLEISERSMTLCQVLLHQYLYSLLKKPEFSYR